MRDHVYPWDGWRDLDDRPVYPGSHADLLHQNDQQADAIYCQGIGNQLYPSNGSIQLKRFVYKYTIYVAFLMSMQCLQVGIVVFGSRDPQFFNYDIDDGFGGIRHVSRMVLINMVALHNIGSCDFRMPDHLYHLWASLHQEVWEHHQPHLSLLL